MNVKPLAIDSESEKIDKLEKEINQLIAEINERDLPDDLYPKINSELQPVRQTPAGNERVLRNSLKKGRGRILRLLEKKAKLVPKGYYRNMHMAIGMTAYGIPMGVAFGIALDNMAFLGIGLPIGLAIGISIGSGMDKKAADEGRQLKTEISF